MSLRAQLAPGRASEPGTWGWLTLFVVAAAGLGLLAPVLGNLAFRGGRSGVIGGVVLVLAAATPTMWRMRRDPLDGPGLYALFTFLYLGFTSLAWLGHPVEPGPGIGPDEVARALRLVAVALALFGLGARLVNRARPAPPLDLSREDFPSVKLMTALAAASAVGTALALAFNRYGYVASAQAANTGSAQLVSFVGVMGGLVVLVAALRYYTTGERQLVLPLAAFTLVAVALAFLSGNKTPALTPPVYLLLAFIVVKRRIPKRAIAVVALFTFLFVVPANYSLRNAVRSQTHAETPTQALVHALTAPPIFNPGRALSDAVTYLFMRFRSIDDVALIQSFTPSHFPAGDGRTYSELPAIIVVPRALWPGKPQLDETAKFTHTYWEAPSEVRSSTQLTQVGDLYRNFGYFGVVLGMLLWGALLGTVNWARQHWRSVRVEVLYLFSIVPSITYIEGDLPDLIAAATKTLPLVAIFAWLVFPRERATQRDGDSNRSSA